MFRMMEAGEGGKIIAAKSTALYPGALLPVSRFFIVARNIYLKIVLYFYEIGFSILKQTL
jgi:hypothetical protein